jgi:hypothetical protein
MSLKCEESIAGKINLSIPEFFALSITKSTSSLNWFKYK